MKSLHLSAQFRALNPNHTSSSSITLLRPCKFNSLSLASPPKPSRLITLCASNSDKPSSESAAVGSIREGFLQFENDPSQSQWNVEVGSPNVPGPSVAKLSLGDQAFFLMAFIACTTSVAFTSLVIAAVPTICAMGRAATSLSKLADTARQELPSTMAAIRLSGMEISDLTLELNDLRFYWRNYFKRQFGTIYMLHVILLAFFIVGWYFMILFRFDHSQEIADGVNKSTQAVQAAEAGIRQIGSLARQQTMSMIQERANLPVISLQPAVIGAAKKTSHAVGQVTKKFMNIISQRDSEDEDDIGIDRVEI